MTVSFVPRPDRATLPAAPYRFSFSAAERSLCQSIFAEHDGKDRLYRREMLAALFFRLLIAVLRRVETGKETEGAENDADFRHQMDRFFSSGNLVNRPTRRDLAQLLHLSERQLNRLMPKIFGMSFQEMLIASRMDFAKFLLRTTDLRIAEIASRVGYGTEGAFHKAFRRRLGVTPARFREQNRKPERN